MPQSEGQQDGRKALVDLGMTDAEIDIWLALANIAGRMLQLPTLHPMERQETATEFHRIQLRLLARPGLRAVGWPRQANDPSTTSEDIT